MLQVSAWPAEPGDAPVYQVATTGGQVQLQYASPSSQHRFDSPTCVFTSNHFFTVELAAPLRTLAISFSYQPSSHSVPAPLVSLLPALLRVLVDGATDHQCVPGLPVLEGSSVAVSGAADPGYGLQLAQV